MSLPARTAVPTLDAVFRAHADFVVRVLRRQGVVESDIDDAVQDVFLTVAEKLCSYEERGAIRAWLFTIARQVASHARRTVDRRMAREAHAERLTSVVPPSPEEHTHDREAAALVRDFLRTLPEEQAQTFYLSEVEGLTAPEIAACDGTNLNTVYARVRLARQRFETFVESVQRGRLRR